MHSIPSNRVSTTGYIFGLGSKRIVAPFCTTRFTLLFKWMAPVRHTPSLTNTRPPPARLASSMALRKASVQSVLPSGLAP